MDQVQLDHLKSAVEALLFVSEKPVTLEQLKTAIQGAGVAELREAVASLMADYKSAAKGIVIVEIAHGYQMLSSPDCAGYIREFYKTRHKEKLTRPSLETLAIIAYKQPVSRTDVELIRGVNSDGVVMHLLNKGLIKIAGRKEVPGRPYVYGTTQQFLEYFGLRSLEDLPKLEDFSALVAQAHEAQPGAAGPDAALAGAEVAPTAPVAVSGDLQEELAKARTRLDIEELEKSSAVVEGFVESPLAGGEPSGQSRLQDGGDATGMTEEKDHGPEPSSQEN
jgi:segregation and condensation protein B